MTVHQYRSESNFYFYLALKSFHLWFFKRVRTERSMAHTGHAYKYEGTKKVGRFNPCYETFSWHFTIMSRTHQASMMAWQTKKICKSCLRSGSHISRSQWRWKNIGVFATTPRLGFQVLILLDDPTHSGKYLHKQITNTHSCSFLSLEWEKWTTGLHLLTPDEYVNHARIQHMRVSADVKNRDRGKCVLVLETCESKQSQLILRYAGGETALKTRSWPDKLVKTQMCLTTAITNFSPSIFSS